MSERDVFNAAREMADPAARSAYLDGACRADAGLRARVEALLRAHDQPDSLLDHPATAAPDPDPAATQALTGTPEPVVAATRTAGGENGPSDDEALTFLAPPTRPDALGRIGHYEALQVLGRGGFGIVFRAFDETLQRVVALKVMAPRLAATSPARKRFLREARSSAQVRHENVVQVYEVAEQPLPYLAMEFIPGETLQQRLDRIGPVEPAVVVRIGRQIAEGLAAAHACDLIHRDVKPANILLEGGQERVKLTDFGLARAADDASISQSGVIAGTPMYMAPEQAKGETLDQRADLFSLGSVLYQMAAGRAPFRANGTVAVLKRVAEDTPRAIREIIPETPQWLCDVIAKLHAKDPDDRYQSAREVADVLADCEAQLKAHAKLKDYSRIPNSKPRRSGRWKWLAATAVLLLPLIALVVTEIAGVTHIFRHSAPTPDPDRQAAEYVLSIGGQVQVDDRDRNINAAAELPRDPFRLTWVGLKDSNQVSGTGLANFKECRNLTFLGLFDTSVSDEGLVNFRNCTKLTFLNLSRTKISDAGLANFKNCTDLTIVVLNETKISDTGLAYLKNSTKLTKLFLQKTKVTAAGIEELQKALPLCKIEWDSGVSEPLPPTFTNSIGMEFKLIPAGKFMMGSSKEEIDYWLKQRADDFFKDRLSSEGPRHEVEITRPFFLGQTKVTVGQFRQFVKATGYKTQAERDGGTYRFFADGEWKKDANLNWLNSGLPQTDDHPVVCISWNDAVEFCNWLSRQEGKNYHLPTEAEWEYSCRAGSKGGWSFGDNERELSDYAWIGGTAQGHTWPVAGLKENAWGLYDTYGNACEWCQDVYDANYYQTSPPKDPAGPSAGDRRVVRGGSFDHSAVSCRSAYRNHDFAEARNQSFGFRVALVVSPPASGRTESGTKDKPSSPPIKPSASHGSNPGRRRSSGSATTRGSSRSSEAAAAGGRPRRPKGIAPDPDPSASRLIDRAEPPLTRLRRRIIPNRGGGSAIGRKTGGLP